MKKRSIHAGAQGQALIELIIFLPLVVTLYSVIGGNAAAINGSINQQKIARAYFYSRVQNNSTVPTPGQVEGVYQGWRRFGMFFIGWKDFFPTPSSPAMPCYRVNIPFKNSPNEQCVREYDKDKTLYVRVGTAYGICGATYVNENGRTYWATESGNQPSRAVDGSSCVIE